MASRTGGDWLTPAEYARHRGVSRVAVHKAIRDGRIAIVRGRISRDVADRDWTENTAPAAPPAGGEASESAAGITYNRARTLEKVVRARIAQFTLDELQKKLVDAEDVLQAADDHGRRVKDALMTLPGRLGPRVAAEKSRVKCEQMILAEVRRLCEELAARALGNAGSGERGPASGPRGAVR